MNAANSDGATPLHDGVARGDEDVIKTLLEHNSNPHIQCYKGLVKILLFYLCNYMQHPFLSETVAQTDFVFN